MPDQLSFQFEPEYSIVGYVPPLGYNEALLNLRTTKVQVSGRGMRGLSLFSNYDEEEHQSDPVYENRYTIEVLDTVIGGDHGVHGILQSDDKFTIVAKLVNQFLANKANEKNHPLVVKYLTENSEQLNQSKRYWRAVAHLNEIASKEREIAELQLRVAKAKVVAQLYAYEVISGKALTGVDRDRKWAEISSASGLFGSHTSESNGI